MKNAKAYLEDANAIVPKISTADGIAKHGSGAIFIDVRDGTLIAETGTIAGALRIPRGMMEFTADPDTPFYNQALNHEAEIILVCGAGGQAALAGKTMTEMGYSNVSNVGGFAAWKEAGGPTES